MTEQNSECITNVTEKLKQKKMNIHTKKTETKFSLNLKRMDM